MKLPLTLIWAGLIPLLGCYAWAHTGTQEETITDERISKIAHGIFADDPDFAWGLVPHLGETIIGAGSSDDWEGIKARRKLHDGDFIWLKTARGTFEIDDAASIARAHAALAPMLEQSKHMEDLSDQMQIHGDRIEQLSSELMRDTDNEALHAQMDTVSHQMQRLSQKMELASQSLEQEVRHAEDLLYPMFKTYLDSGMAKPVTP